MKLDRYYGGCRPSRPTARGTHMPHEMAPIGNPTPDSVDRSALLPEVLNQGQQGSCTGHGVSEGIWAAMNAVAPVERPSPRWLYDLGRAVDGTPLTEDAGSNVASVLHGAVGIGVVKNSDNPYTDSVLYTPKSDWPEQERLAFDQRIVEGTARITATGAALVDACRAALAAGYLPVFGTDVDNAFETLGSHDVWPGCKGQSLGGHCMVLTGYQTVKVRTQFRIRNSWGLGWADNGSCWCDQDALAGFWDVWIVKTAPSWSGTVDG